MKPRESQKGVIAVEFALIALPMLLMVFGITEFGRAIYQYDTIAKSVRSAARHLSETSPTGSTYPAKVTEARCLAVFGTLDCSGTALVPGLATTMVDVCDSAAVTACPGQAHASVSTGSGLVNLVTVRVTAYPFNSFVEWVLADITFGNATAADPSRRGIAVTMRQDL